MTTQTPAPDEISQETEPLSPEEKEMRKIELLRSLEEERQEGALGRLCRSKTFWYAVFGTLLLLFMGWLLLWVARDLGYR